MIDHSIQTGLEQDARRIEERMPDKMTQQAILDVRLRLREFIGQRGWSQTKIGQTVGFKDGSVISSFLKGDYKGDVEGLSKKLHEFMESCARRKRKPHGPAFIETAVAKKIFTVINETDGFSDEEEGKIGIIAGDGGHGKSLCMKQYAQTHKNSIYVELDDAMTSKMMFGEIAKKLRVDESGSRASITRGLINNLQNRQMIILLDEASSLSVCNLNLLRQIIVVKSRCPLILAGNRQLLKTVMQPTTKPGCESLDQFTSRLMCVLDLDELADDPDGGLYTAEDIRRLYEYGGIRLTADAVGTLQKIARTGRTGRLRNCSHIVTACHYSAKVQKQKFIDTGWILGALKKLKLPVTNWLPMIITEPPREKQQKAAEMKTG